MFPFWRIELAMFGARAHAPCYLGLRAFPVSLDATVSAAQCFAYDRVFYDDGEVCAFKIERVLGENLCVHLRM